MSTQIATLYMTLFQNYNLRRDSFIFNRFNNYQCETEKVQSQSFVFNGKNTYLESLLSVYVIINGKA